VELIAPSHGAMGRPPTPPTPTAPRISAKALIEVRVADGPRMAGGKRLPGDAAWLVCERRATGERKYYLTNHPPRPSLL
jgi:hypothetical protein